VRGSRSGSTEARRRVSQAARELGYSVSPAAQAIKGGRANSVALVVGDIDDIGAATMIAGVMHAAERRGVSVAVRATHDESDEEAALLTRLRGERHRAVIIGTSRTTDSDREAALAEQLRILHEQGAKIVMIGESALDYPHVTVDQRRAASELASALVSQGHRQFGIIAGPGNELTSRDRVDGFVDGLASAGITPAVEVAHEVFSRDGGYRATRRLGVDVRSLDVLAAMSDAMAVGALAACHELGVRVPDEVTITGFDRIPLLGDVMPWFSTVDVPLEAFGEAAMRLALDSPIEGARADIALHAVPIINGHPAGR
jgi:LacI family transcriptional regulator